MLVVLVLNILIFCLVTYRWKRQRFYQLASKLPGNDELSFFKKLQIYFHLFSHPRDTLLFGEKLIKVDQPITKIWIFNKLIILSKSLDIVRKVLNSHQGYNKPPELISTISARNSIVVLNGEEHNRHRKILSKAFSQRNLKRLPEVFEKNSKQTLKRMEVELNAGEFEIFDYIGSNSLTNIAQSTFNYDIDSFRSELYDVLKGLVDGIEALFPLIFFRIPPKMMGWIEAGRNFQKKLLFFENHAKDIIEYNKKNLEDEKDSFINLLLNPENEFMEEDVTDEILGLYITGFDTTTKATATTIMLLGIYQDVQQKVMDEINLIFSTEINANLTYDFIQKFKYLDAVINESLRLFPIAPIISRRLSEDLDLNGYLIPKDAIFVTTVFAIHRDKNIWGNDAHLFKPERFMEKLNNPQAYIPFGVGKRMCIGYRYAKISLKIFLINFLRTYKVFCSQKIEDLKIEITVAIEFAGGYRVSIEKR